jgi:hypothetical protein
MTETTTLPIAFPEDVLRYCESWGLVADLHTAFRIAEQAYAPAKGWEIAIEPDPEIEDEYVVIDVAIIGDLEEILRKQNAFSRRWSREASSEGTWRIRVLWKIA